MSEFLRLSSATWSLVHILLLFMLFYNPRYSRKKTLILTGINMLTLVILNIVLLWWLGRETYGQIILFTLVLPSFLFFFFMAKHRDFRFIFTFCVVDTVSAEIIIISMLADTFLANDSRILMFIIRILAFPIIEYLAIKKLRKSYIEIQNSLKKGWGVLSFVSVLFYVMLLTMIAYPSLITERPKDVPVMVLLLVLMPLMYLNIFQILAHQNKIHIMQHEQELLQL